MEYTIYYPSGYILSLTGNFLVADGGKEHGCLPCLERTDTSVVILDPRGVVRCKNSTVYLPAWHKERLAEWAQEWLREHPEWPPRDLQARRSAP